MFADKQRESTWFFNAFLSVLKAHITAVGQGGRRPLVPEGDERVCAKSGSTRSCGARWPRGSTSTPHVMVIITCDGAIHPSMTFNPGKVFVETRHVCVIEIIALINDEHIKLQVGEVGLAIPIIIGV